MYWLVEVSLGFQDSGTNDLGWVKNFTWPSPLQQKPIMWVHILQSTDLLTTILLKKLCIKVAMYINVHSDFYAKFEDNIKWKKETLHIICKNTTDLKLLQHYFLIVVWQNGDQHQNVWLISVTKSKIKISYWSQCSNVSVITTHIRLWWCEPAP